MKNHFQGARKQATFSVNIWLGNTAETFPTTVMLQLPGIGLWSMPELDTETLPGHTTSQMSL